MSRVWVLALVALGCGPRVVQQVVVPEETAREMMASARRVDFCDYGRLPMGGVVVDFTPPTEGCPEVEALYFGANLDARVRVGYSDDLVSFETWVVNGQCMGVVNQALDGGGSVRDAFTFDIPRAWGRAIRSGDRLCQYTGTITGAGRR